MSPNTREPQAPESYATFWEPLPSDAPPGGAPQDAPKPDATNKDAYAEFVDVTEDTQLPLRATRA